MPYALLSIAVVCEVFGDSMMKLSNGFARKLPILGVFCGYAGAFYLEAIVLEFLPLGFTYATWCGAGIALTAIVGAIFWHEGMNLKKVVALLAIIAGIVVMKLGV